MEDYPFRLEYGTPNTMGIAGLAAGLAFIADQGGVTAIHAKEMELARVLWETLRGVDGLTLYCADSLERRTPVFAFNFEGVDPAQAGARLDVDYNIACRTGLHCAPLVHESLGTARDGAVRFSVGPLTTLADVEAGAKAVEDLMAEVRS